MIAWMLSISSIATASVTGKTGKVSGITTGWGAEGYYFGLDSGTSGCSNPLFVVASSRSDYKVVVANIMLAYTLGKPISVYSDTCISGGASNVVGVSF